MAGGRCHHRYSDLKRETKTSREAIPVTAIPKEYIEYIIKLFELRETGNGIK